MRTPCIITATLALTYVASPALAQETPPAPSVPIEDFGGDSITIGIGAAIVPSYEGADDYQILPAPGAIGSYKGYAFLVAGNRFSADVIRNGDSEWDIQFGPVGVLDFNRNSRGSIDDPRVRALPQRDIAIELGGYAGVGKTGVFTSAYDKLSFTVSYRYDVNGVHSSGILAPTATYVTPLSRKSAVGFFVSGERVERGYTRAYFNVTPADSLASGLPVYNGRGWKNYTLGAFGTVALTGDLLHGWKLVAGGTYRRLLNDTADSPLVAIAGSKNQWLGAAGDRIYFLIRLDTAGRMTALFGERIAQAL